MPFIRHCLEKTDVQRKFKEWFLVTEDSCKLFQGIMAQNIHDKVQQIPNGMDIFPTGYKRLQGKGAKLRKLDLQTMKYLSSPESYQNFSK